MSAKKELIAKVKFYFGQEQQIFKENLLVEITENGYAYIYKPENP